MSDSVLPGPGVKEMDSSQPQEGAGDLVRDVENLRTGIRELAHEINNPLGIIRMALYFLQTTDPTGEKRDHYFKVIDEGLGRIDESLQRLKALRENPSQWTGKQAPEA